MSDREPRCRSKAPSKDPHPMEHPRPYRERHAETLDHNKPIAVLSRSDIFDAIRSVSHSISRHRKKPKQSMLNLDPGKLLIVAIVAIIVLGPDKLPHAAQQVGRTWRSFNEFRRHMEAEVRSNIPDLPSTNELARLARSPTALLDHLGGMSSEDPPTDPDASEQGCVVDQSDLRTQSGVLPSAHTAAQTDDCLLPNPETQSPARVVSGGDAILN
jgi:Sec-independent protein translocase protein TatA